MLLATKIAVFLKANQRVPKSLAKTIGKEGKTPLPILWRPADRFPPPLHPSPPNSNQNEFGSIPTGGKAAEHFAAPAASSSCLFWPMILEFVLFPVCPCACLSSVCGAIQSTNSLFKSFPTTEKIDEKKNGENERREGRKETAARGKRWGNICRCFCFASSFAVFYSLSTTCPHLPLRKSLKEDKQTNS